MRVCLLGDFRNAPDEGMRKFATNLAKVMQDRVDLLCLDLRNIISVQMELRRFEPDVVQYVPGPTPISLAILKIVKLMSRERRTITTLTHPQFINNSAVWNIFRPDLALTFSPSRRQRLQQNGIRASLMPVAVDTEIFQPSDFDEKASLRKTLGIPIDSYVALHVGHIRKGRGIMALSGLPSQGVKAVIVGSQSTGQDIGLKRKLTKEGCVVVDSYIERIEQFYKAADCYVFPTEVSWRGMDFPLSVLEAMACNLPVVTMDHGSISELFSEVAGVYFASSNEDLLNKVVAKARTIGENIETREAVSSLTWDNLAEFMLSTYREEMNARKL